MRRKDNAVLPSYRATSCGMSHDANSRSLVREQVPTRTNISPFVLALYIKRRSCEYDKGVFFWQRSLRGVVATRVYCSLTLFVEMKGNIQPRGPPRSGWLRSLEQELPG